MMKKIVFLALFYAPFSIATDWFAGIGEIYRADDSGHKMLVVSAKKGIWTASIARWETYPRTAWLSDHPEWGVVYNPKHFTASIVATIYEKKILDELTFFIDFGLGYAEKLSDATSSHVQFRENFGLAYKKARLYLRHMSNAGIKLPNRGEDALVLELNLEW
jgi:hypothetical protein